jgi:hypothetical protein
MNGDVIAERWAGRSRRPAVLAASRRGRRGSPLRILARLSGWCVQASSVEDGQPTAGYALLADVVRTRGNHALAGRGATLGAPRPAIGSAYGQLSRSVSNSTVAVPSGLTVTCATKWSVMREPSVPLTLTWPVKVVVKALPLTFSPNQKVAWPV